MTVAHRPSDFNYGLHSPDNSSWEIGGELYATNPKFLLTPNNYEMLSIWRLFQGGMAAGHLPETGGSMNQAAIMMDAFYFMNHIEEKLKHGRFA